MFPKRCADHKKANVELSVNNHSVYAGTANQPLDPSRQSVVFIHGAGQDHSIWAMQARYFARKGRNVLSIDLPGHGRSDGPPLESIEQMSDWLIALLDAAGIEQASLVGHSMGSLIALATAARHTDRVRSIALVATAVPMPVGEGLLASALANDHDAVDMLTYWGHSSQAHIGGSPNPGMWMLGCGIRLMERANEGVIHSDLKACNDYSAGLDDAGQVGCPALLILGERDLMTSVRGTRTLEEKIAAAETIIFPGAGHALLNERPDQVLDALIRIV